MTVQRFDYESADLGAEDGDQKTTPEPSPARNGASEGQGGGKGAREKGLECSLTTDVGSFERAAITREEKRAGGYPPLAKRFNGGFARPG